jgi:phosphohistidine phosphatase SixA
MRRLKLLAAALAMVTPAMAYAQPSAPQELQGAALIRALQRGGYVLVMRHAHAPLQPPAASAADPANTNHERQLDETGRSTARAMGTALKSLHIPVGEVWSSPTYRARETVRLAGLPNPRIAPELGDQGHSMQAASGDQGAWLRTKTAQAPRAGTDIVIVSHAPNISAAFGQTAANLGDGGTLVFHPRRGLPPQFVGRIPIEKWPSLARASQGDSR